MSKSDILSYFYTNSESLTPYRILLVMAAALAGAVLIHIVYRATCVDGLYNGSFNNGNILLALITTVIMLMISSNIVISLGMVGALSIVRFRTAVKDARDTIFLFWSIVLGLCVGSQNFLLAGISTLFIGAVTLVLSFLPHGAGRCTVIVRGSGVDAAALEAALHGASRRARLEAVNHSAAESEWVYAVSVKPDRAAALAETLRAVPGVAQVNLVSARAEE
jgi:hypothetical protein